MSSDRYIGFGERIGAVQALSLPLDDVTIGFRQAVWNAALLVLTAERVSMLPFEFLQRFSLDKRWDMDGIRRMPSGAIIQKLSTWLRTQSAWHEVYEFIESFPRWAGFDGTATDRWEAEANRLLEQELSPYRFVNHRLVPIVTEYERAAVAEASSLHGLFDAATTHLRKAVAYFAARPHPDYENALKEGVLSLESAITIANGKHMDFGPACDSFAQRYSVHPSLMQAAKKIYGYASDEEGVRHGKESVGTKVSFEDAKLAITSSAAWVTYIAAKVNAAKT